MEAKDVYEKLMEIRKTHLEELKKVLPYNDESDYDEMDWCGLAYSFVEYIDKKLKNEMK